MEAPTTKDIVAQVLHVPNTDDWDIVDSDGNLCLAHYSKDADTSKFGHIRGSIVDIDKRVMVADSFGHTPRVPIDEIVPTDAGLYSFQTATGEEVSVPADRAFFRRGLEGVMLRIFLHDGKIRASSNRKLDASQSRWGMKTVSFLEIYQQLGGNLEYFYAPGKRYSPLVHVVLVVHPDLLDVSKEDVGRGYISYLNTLQIWDVVNPPYPADEVDVSHQIPPLVTLSEAKEGKGYYNPKVLSLEEANTHLRFGFLPEFKDDDQDQRLGTGEFVVLYATNEYGAIHRLFRMESTAYSWRASMRGGEPVFTFRFFQLMDSVLTRAEESAELYRSFLAKFPLVPNYSEELFKSHVKTRPMYFPTGEVNPALIETRRGREIDVWICYVLAVPPHEQGRVVDLLDVYRETTKEVVEWIQSLEGEDNLPEIVNRRVKDILRRARLQAKRSRGRAPMSTKIKEAIRSRVLEENPSSVYRIQRNKDEVARKTKKEKIVRVRI